MTNLIRSDFQAHPFHLVSPSPWPFYSSISLLTLICIYTICVIFDFDLISWIIQYIIPVAHADSVSPPDSEAEVPSLVPDSELSPELQAASESGDRTDSEGSPHQTVQPLNTAFWVQGIQALRGDLGAGNSYNGVPVADNTLLGIIASQFYEAVANESQEVVSQAAELGRTILVQHGFYPNDVAEQFTPDGINVSSDTESSTSDAPDASEASEASDADDIDEQPVTKKRKLNSDS